jgi:hypothetical protein
MRYQGQPKIRWKCKYAIIEEQSREIEVAHNKSAHFPTTKQEKCWIECQFIWNIHKKRKSTVATVTKQRFENNKWIKRFIINGVKIRLKNITVKWKVIKVVQ